MRIMHAGQPTTREQCADSSELWCDVNSGTHIVLVGYVMTEKWLGTFDAMESSSLAQYTLQAAQEQCARHILYRF